jgi:Ankyrin repeats (3 copies)
LRMYQPSSSIGNIKVRLVIIAGSMLSDTFTECLTSLHFDEMFSRRDQVNTALVNTYQWIWDHPNYTEWYSSEGTDRSKILWIKGKPGSGKSTLAKMIRKSLGSMFEGPLLASSGLETYNESDTTNATASGPKSYDGSSMDIVADFFFSSRSGEKSRSPKWMLQALLYQILAQNPKLYEHFREGFQEFRATKSSWDYPTLKKIFSALCGHVSQQRVFVTPRFYLVIDAFDETESYENIDRTDFLDLLSSLCSAEDINTRPACILKVLLVSRPASDIESKLRVFSSIEMHEQTMMDIEKIVTSGLEAIVLSLKDPSRRASETIDSQVYSDDEDNTRSTGFGELEETSITDLLFLWEYLIEHANGVILWVVLIIKELRSLFLEGFWTLREVKQMVSSLPQDLEQCYEEMIARIMKAHEKNKLKDRFGKEQLVAKTHMMLTWATFAYRPLTFGEFRDVIAIWDIQNLYQSAHNIPKDSTTFPPMSLLPEYRLQNEKQVHKAVLYFCGGFLESVGGVKYKHDQSFRHVSKTDVLQLLHRSAKDFLLSNNRATPFQLHKVPAASSISFLATKYLELSLPGNDLPANPENWNTEDYKRFIRHLKDLPLLEYILFALPKHLQGSGSQELKDSLARYLSALRRDEESYSWKFLQDWARRNTLLGDAPSHSIAALRFRMRCIRTAAELGKSRVVGVIIEAGVEDLSEALLAASICGDTASVRSIFNQGQLEKLTTCKDAFLAAVKRGHLSIVSTVITSGKVQPDVRMDRGASALHFASAEGHLRIMKYLINAGSDLEAEDENGVRPLHTAALAGRLEAVKLLIASGASLQAHTKMVSGFERTPLTFAVMAGCLDIVTFIIGKYELLDSMDISGGGLGMIRDDGSDALQLAKSNRHEKIAQSIESALSRAEQRSFTAFKAEDAKVVAARRANAAKQASSLAGEGKGKEKETDLTADQESNAESQNSLIERLIGQDLSPRESVHLLSFAQPSNERSRGTQRFSRAFLSSPGK